MGWKLLIHSQTATIEVWEWISNVIPHFSGCVIPYPCWCCDSSSRRWLRYCIRVFPYKDRGFLLLFSPHVWFLDSYMKLWWLWDHPKFTIEIHTLQKCRQSGVKRHIYIEKHTTMHPKFLSMPHINSNWSADSLVLKLPGYRLLQFPKPIITFITYI